ncbi:TNF receptor-associated factor homolog 1a-like [Trifolium pratense]|uniref:TNF receptor-associated factor homolog 1a-like n=1 Tax=Trifolium pratense TaxID=57577 RepID=UPI001E695EC6|nr:TNF receptor-associated factor homolog 1a-like [Trifolium pratense]
MEEELEIHFRNVIRKCLEKHDEEDRSDASKLYKKESFILKPNYPPHGDDDDNSKVIILGDYKWTFAASHVGTSLQFELSPDDNNPMLKFYALNTVAIIHPHDYMLTQCSDRFHSLCDGYPMYSFHCEEGFLDDEGNVKVELQTQIFGENVFQPLLVKKYRVELLLTKMHIVNIICSKFFKKTIDNMKSLIQDENKWPRFCTFIEESDQFSMGQMICEKEDVIKEALVHHFFLDAVLTSPLLMEILYDGYESINANNTAVKFVRIEGDLFELVDDDVPSLFKRVVGKEYKPIYSTIVTQFGCMIVEIFVLDYLFRNKIEKNFTQSELDRT